MQSQVLILPKGTAQTGYGPDGQQNGLQWTSQYTVAGLNGFHVDLIIDGLNEQGLSGGMLMFPPSPRRSQPTRTSSTALSPPSSSSVGR